VRILKLIKEVRDAVLRASWVFSYAAILMVFRLLQRVERGKRLGRAK